VARKLRGILAEAPYIRLHPDAEPNRLTVIAGRLAKKVLPHYQMVNKLNLDNISHDPVENKAIGDDPLCHDTSTLEGLAGMLDRAEELDKGKVVIEDREGCGFLITHGMDDKITSCEASKNFFEKLQVKDKTLKLYDGCYHCRMFTLQGLYDMTDA
jgi:acylglycerol lipase